MSRASWPSVGLPEVVAVEPALHKSNKNRYNTVPVMCVDVLLDGKGLFVVLEWFGVDERLSCRVSQG